MFFLSSHVTPLISLSVLLYRVCSSVQPPITTCLTIPLFLLLDLPSSSSLFLSLRAFRGHAVTLFASSLCSYWVPVQLRVATRSAFLSAPLSIAFHSPLKDGNQNPPSKPQPSSPSLHPTPRLLCLSTFLFYGSLHLCLSYRITHTHKCPCAHTRGLKVAMTSRPMNK